MSSALNFRLDHRVALVTGSSTGIGLAMARGLAQAGATVVLNARNAARLHDAAGALRAEGLKAHARAFDVGDSAAVDAAVAEIEAEVGPIDILVNNAGTTRRVALTEVSDADWRTVLQTNLDAAFFLGRAVARRMIPRKR
ncbi:MAG TPA: SDR family NAD(P)-dependent oxidoreductase, partial [Burkholderiaceae bacterium]|nr:SDR family NAD(P)-dependent oxidoreductase [Burkholderiaceae bacterium]